MASSTFPGYLVNLVSVEYETALAALLQTSIMSRQHGSEASDYAMWLTGGVEPESCRLIPPPKQHPVNSGQQNVTNVATVAA
eukprot:4416992-Prymnesium_polylepis.1